MTLTINLNVEQEARLAELAEAEGCDAQSFLQGLVDTTLAGPGTQEKSGADLPRVERLLTQEEMDELRQSGEELDKLKRAINANRAINGERLLFP